MRIVERINESISRQILKLVIVATPSEAESLYEDLRQTYREYLDMRRALGQHAEAFPPSHLDFLHSDEEMEKLRAGSHRLKGFLRRRSEVYFATVTFVLDDDVGAAQDGTDVLFADREGKVGYFRYPTIPDGNAS